MSKTSPFSIRLDPEVKADLEKLAEAQNRTLNNLISTVLRDYVRDAKRGGKK